MTNIYQPIWINFISKDWEELIFNEYVAGPESQPNIGCCPLGPAKVCWVIIESLSIAISHTGKSYNLIYDNEDVHMGIILYRLALCNNESVHRCVRARLTRYCVPQCPSTTIISNFPK